MCETVAPAVVDLMQCVTVASTVVGFRQCVRQWRPSTFKSLCNIQP